jgi:hypothetical protein
MRRKHFTFCSAVSLFLFMAVCVPWGSHTVSQEIVYASDRRVRLVSGDGGFFVERVTLTRHTGLSPDEDRQPLTNYLEVSVPYLLWQSWGNGDRTRWHFRAAATPPGPRRQLIGPVRFEPGWLPGLPDVSDRIWVAARDANTTDEFWLTGRGLWLPDWCAALVTALLPGAWVRRAVIRHRREARFQQRRCPACGYDLRATPERCPECGLARATA